MLWRLHSSQDNCTRAYIKYNCPALNWYWRLTGLENRIYLFIYYTNTNRSGIELETYAMEATRFLEQEDSLVVWDSVERALRYPTLILERYHTTYALYTVNISLRWTWTYVHKQAISKVYAKCMWCYPQEYMRSRIEPVYERFGWDNGDDTAIRQ